MTSLAPRPQLLIGARSYFRELWQRREFAWYLAMGNLKARNASTALGLMWWVLNPLILGGIYVLVFGAILHVSRGQPDYLAYLLAGMFAFSYTRGAMVGGVNVLIANLRMVANLKFPRLILPFAALVEAAVGFMTSVAAFYLIVWPFNGVHPTRVVWLLIPAFLIHTVFNFGLGAASARLAVPFRDVNNLIPYVLRLWLYLTPIIYPLSFVENMGDTARTFAEANPLFSIIAMYRAALLGYPLEMHLVWAAVAWAVGILVVAVYAFVRYEGRMAKYV
ncbi:MAG: ABC transporter permease [Acidimicrobiia bacterium]